METADRLLSTSCRTRSRQILLVKCNLSVVRPATTVLGPVPASRARPYRLPVVKRALAPDSGRGANARFTTGSAWHAWLASPVLICASLPAL